MSWTLFIDESGQDMRQSPYEVLAGVAVEDRKLWPLIRRLSDLQDEIFGTRLFAIYQNEAKAQKLLKTKVFKHAAQMDPIEPARRRELAREILEDGANVSRERLTALAQAKIAYCESALATCLKFDVDAFASIVPKSAPRPRSSQLRKDYAYLFERFFYFLNSQPDDPMGYIVFDELDKSASHILLTQVAEYFLNPSCNCSPLIQAPKTQQQFQSQLLRHDASFTFGCGDSNCLLLILSLRLSFSASFVQSGSTAREFMT